MKDGVQGSQIASWNANPGNRDFHFIDLQQCIPWDGIWVYVEFVYETSSGEIEIVRMMMVSPAPAEDGDLNEPFRPDYGYVSPKERVGGCTSVEIYFPEGWSPS